jgi:hypothetical protein
MLMKTKPDHYLPQFEQVAQQLQASLLNKKGMQIKTGVWLNSAVLRLQKDNWINKPDKEGNSSSRIFFSVWINEQGIKESRLFYNIHALKLRHLDGYLIESRKFAFAFREKFNAFMQDWPNVSIAFGPLTLMQGWKQIDLNDFKHDISELANRFLTIDHIIDELLDNYRKPI